MSCLVSTMTSTACSVALRLFTWTRAHLLNVKMDILCLAIIMDHSYKPVLIKAILKSADAKGRVNLDDIVSYFRSFYEERRLAGLTVEKRNSIFAKDHYTDKEALYNILSNPFKRFENMQMLHHTKTLGIIQVDESVWKKLTWERKQKIEQICDEKLEQYYQRIKENG